MKRIVPSAARGLIELGLFDAFQRIKRIARHLHLAGRMQAVVIDRYEPPAQR